MTTEFFLLDEDSIRRQQADAVRTTLARLMAAVEGSDYADAPGRSCELLAEALVDALEGVGVRFGDRRGAVMIFAVALWGGIAAVVADAQREELETEPGDEDVELAPVFVALAPAFNLIGALADSITTATLPAGLEDLAGTLRDQLAEEGMAGGDDAAAGGTDDSR